MRDESQFYDALDVEADRPRSRFGAAAAALVSVALLAAMVVWAYRLGVRDANDVPVIRAVEGPGKTRPDDPGGANFEHQGRSVYGLMEGEPIEVREVTVAPPPEQPVEEDFETARRAAAAPAEDAPETAPAADTGFDPAGEVERLVAAVLGEATAPTAYPAGLVPEPRPAPGAAAPTRAATGSVSGPVVQLGAYLSEADALMMWEAVRRRSGDLLSGATPVVSPPREGESTLWRLRVGPYADAAAASAACGALRARGEDCLTARID